MLISPPTVLPLLSQTERPGWAERPEVAGRPLVRPLRSLPLQSSLILRSKVGIQPAEDPWAWSRSHCALNVRGLTALRSTPSPPRPLVPLVLVCTCMPLLKARTDFPGETPEVPQDPCQHWKGIFRFWHRLHTRSWAAASTGEESREAPEQLAWGLAFPEATRAGP